MLPTFAHAMQRRSVRIAGVKLGPVTLAHLYCLHAWESPVVCGGQIELADFGLALWTCSRECWPFSEYVNDVDAAKADRKLARWGRCYDLREFPRDVEALKAWLGWHCRVPPRFLRPTKDDRGPSAPWPMIVAVQLIPAFGEARVWRMPVPEAMAYKIALDNAQGDTSWKSETEEAQGYANGSSSQSDS